MAEIINWKDIISSHNIIGILIIFIIADIIFGTLRAIKQRCFNSSVGIDGILRKTGMLFSMVFCTILDAALHLDLLNFIPDDINAFAMLKSAGLTEFFGLLFIAYEIISVLKNMALSGLPVEGVWHKVYTFLSKWTKELPQTDVKGEEE